MNAVPALKVADVCKHFALGDQTVEVLRGVSLCAEMGQSLALIGPSGSGKSTLLHLLGTLEPPTSGRIAISGQDPLALPEPQLARFRNQHIGFVFQNHHLLPQYSALENALIPTLAFPSAELRRSASSAEPSKPQADRRERARDLLTAVGLAERLHHRPAELSGGECQRVAVARALINQPGLLLCDEPTGSLDRQTATTVADLLFTLHRAEQAALVIATHDLELAARCDRRLHLARGDVRRSLIYYWRVHLGLLLGTAVATTALTGALLVGDSMRGSLRDLALERLGHIDYALLAAHFFRSDLTTELPGGHAPVILLNGSARHAETQTLAAGVQIQGIDIRFAALFPGSGPTLRDALKPSAELRRSASSAEPSKPTPGQPFPSLVVSASLQRALGLELGDAVLLSLERPSPTYRESLFGRRATDDLVTTLRVVLTGVLPDSGAGRFGLRPHQHLPLNAYLDLQALQRALDQQDRVNALLIAAPNSQQQDLQQDLAQHLSSRRPQAGPRATLQLHRTHQHPLCPRRFDPRCRLGQRLPPYSSKPRPSRPIWPTPLKATVAKSPTQPLPPSTIPPASALQTDGPRHPSPPTPSTSTLGQPKSWPQLPVIRSP